MCFELGTGYPVPGSMCGHRVRPSQDFIETMHRLTDGVHWNGIGGPGELKKVLLLPFAAAVRERTEQQSNLIFDRLKGAALPALLVTLLAKKL